MAKRGKSNRQDKRAALTPKGKPRRYLRQEHIDYRDVEALRRFISDRGKIRSRRVTGASRRQQRLIARAVKRARELALIPYVNLGADDREERRGRGGRDRDR